MLLEVGKIEPGTQKTYDEVAPQIKREIAENRAKTEIGDLRDKIEDERAAGSTLAETAKKLGLTSHTIDAVDRSGRGPDGKPIADLPKAPDVIAAAFSSDVGVDNDALQLPNGGYLWYDVTGITPSRERTLDEVKDQVDDALARRRDRQAPEGQDRRHARQAQGRHGARAGCDRERAARCRPRSICSAASRAALRRRSSSMPPSRRPRYAGSADGDKQTERFVFRVTDVIDPKLDPHRQRSSISTALQNSYSDDIVGEYVARLETNLGVTINQQALNQVIGGGTPQ